MAPIPLTLVGILPAHALMGAFFTATSMIGFIAGAGIIVRNSIILVDFIELRCSQGMSLEEAVVDAGAVRFRPMLLTAAAVVVGASVILFDPIFQGLALSLMAGEVASTVLSRMAVPVLYYMSKKESGLLPPTHPHSPENVAECETPRCEVVQNSLDLTRRFRYDRRTYTSVGRWDFHPRVASSRTLCKPLLVSFHRFRRTESIPVSIHQLVPNDDVPAQARGKAVEWPRRWRRNMPDWAWIVAFVVV